jgi:hypothetical protein
MPYFSNDDSHLLYNAHPNIFITFLCIDNAYTPISGLVKKYRQRTEEFFKNTFVASSCSNIESDGEFFGFE